MSDHFVTEFGHRLDFVPGYFERNKTAAYLAKHAPLTTGLTTHTEPLPLRAPIKDWVQFSCMIEFMARNDLLRARGSAIDLGGAEGTIARLFKAAGLVGHATNLDVIDFSTAMGDNYFVGFLSRIMNLETEPDERRLKIKAVIAEAKSNLDFFSDQPAMAGLFKTFPDAPSLDVNLHMSAMDAPGTYDLVLTSACLEYFDLEKALPKIRSLLNAGGAFVGLIGYWWYALNSTGIVGDFPFACQRLSHGDLVRYFSEHHPDLLDIVHSRYNYFHEGAQHPTVRDLTDLAQKHGLRPIAIERIVPKRHHLLRDIPNGGSLDDVLRDVGHLHSVVTRDDLTTSALKFAFVAR